MSKTAPREDVFEGRALKAVRGGRIVFEDLSFRVKSGGALVLTGPNGSGKSTLLRLAATLLEPAEGGLSWNGAAVVEEIEAFRERVVYVGHLDAVKPVFTARENIAAFAALWGTDDRAVEAALEAFRLVELAELPARFLSAGQKRRVALARLLVSPAPLWLLDEPTVALDAASVAALGEVIKAHRAAGGMVIAATHLELGFEGAEALTLRPGRIAA